MEIVEWARAQKIDLQVYNSVDAIARLIDEKRLPGATISTKI